MDTERIGPPLLAGERESLRAFLDFHRATLALKCEGLTDEQLRRPASPPSTLSLLGLVRHMADVERWWFRIRAAGQDVPTLYDYSTDPDADHNDVADADPAEAFATLRAEIEAAREAVAGLPLEHTFQHRRGDTTHEVSLRWVYVHMIEEYARHNGHADLIRERIDGVTGA